MDQANHALITSRAQSALPSPTFSTIQADRPASLPAIDRSALMRRAHAIARKARPHMASYREALAYGPRAAWGLVATAREFAAVRARVAPVTHTAEQIAATRRCGASYMPF
jgi:hypothetical protein